MIADKFEYATPRSVQEASELLAENPTSSTILAGGTWVVPEMSQHLRRPSTVIDLRAARLDRVAAEDGAIVIGATATYTAVSGSDDAPAVLRQLADGVTGGAQIRNQGTLGGSACYANPASDVPGALVALGATMRLRTADGSRDAAASEFFVDAFTTQMRPGEVLEAIAIDPDVASRPAAHLKLKVAEGSWPIVTATCTADKDGTISSVVLGGAASTPVVVPVSNGVSGEELADSARDLVVEPWADVLATANYRRHVAGVMAVRAVENVRALAVGDVA